MLLLMYCLFAQELPLQEVAGDFHFGYENAVLTFDSEILYAGTDRLCHWDVNGALLRTIDIENILAFHYSGTRYVIAHETATGTRQTALFDAKGNHLRNIPAYSTFYTFMESAPFGPRGDGVPALGANPYPHLLCELGPDYEPLPGGRWFFRATELQRQLDYEFNRVWVAQMDGATFAVNELEQKAFFLEFSFGDESTPNNHEVLELTLPGFIPFKRTQRAEEPREDWLNSFSRITWFGRYDEGFMVAYTIAITGRQMVRTMGPSFGGRGMVPVRKGQIAIGAEGKHIVTLKPQKTATGIAPIVRKTLPTAFSDIKANEVKK